MYSCFEVIIGLVFKSSLKGLMYIRIIRNWMNMCALYMSRVWKHLHSDSKTTSKWCKSYYIYLLLYGRRESNSNTHNLKTYNPVCFPLAHILTVGIVYIFELPNFLFLSLLNFFDFSPQMSSLYLCKDTQILFPLLLK